MKRVMTRLPIFACALLLAVAGLPRLAAAAAYTALESPRIKYNFNVGWKFAKVLEKGQHAGAERVEFDDSAWETVSTPHTFNDVDSFDKLATADGDKNVWQGQTWYRKRFRLPGQSRGGKVFIEFEGLRSVGRFYINGKYVGIHENAVMACGIDITEQVQFGDRENVLAVEVNNTWHYFEENSKSPFQWGGAGFYPISGGLNRNVYLHVTGPVYQTLPLYSNLGTTGIYVYAKDFNVPARSAVIHVDSEVRNTTAKEQSVSLAVDLVDMRGGLKKHFQSAPQNIPAGGTAILHASAPVSELELWDVHTPNLYDVYTTLLGGNTPMDVCKTSTGFRKTDFKGGVGTGGIFINDRRVMLQGYAQRSTSEWAGLGSAYPDWMHDYTARSLADSMGNHIRWMHVTPKAADVRACDRMGITQAMPAGDSEKDAQGRMWEQRVELMRDAIIYHRNSPSILLYEAGNEGVSPEHMKEMRELRERWDPHGGRAMGCRTLHGPDYSNAEYMGTMLSQRYSDAVRDLVPIVEHEDMRDEAARRFWDDFSPPHFGFKPVEGQDVWAWNSETFCLAAAKTFFRYNNTFAITNTDPKTSRYSGYTSIMFTDSNSHGRQRGSEVCRVSGKVDAVRLPKQSYYLYRVMQNADPDIHIIGHWSYPAGTKKTMYVASNCEAVELFVNGKSKGKLSTPNDRVIFSFPDVAWEPGSISAVGYVNGRKAAQHELKTVGAPKQIRLTPIVGPDGWRADGADIALLDVEVVDGSGMRCPTDEGRVDFKVEGPCVWRGGYNSGKVNSTNNLYLDTECGINRVAVRSTLEPGSVRITASRPGLAPDVIELKSVPFQVANGLSRIMPAALNPRFGKVADGKIAAKPVAATESAGAVATAVGMPAPFTFTEVKGAATFSFFTSNPIAVSGIKDPVAIRISESDEDASYSLNGGPFTAEEGTAKNGDVVRVRLGSGSVKGATYRLSLAVGGQAGEFRVTTKSQP